MFGLIVMALQAATPLTNPAFWSNNADYPAAALRAGDEGTAGYELYVERSGSVTDCKIVKSSGSPILDAATCPHLVKVARFSPVDASGELVRRYRGEVAWRIEADPPISEMTMLVNALPSGLIGTHTDVAFTVATSGRVADCRIVESSGSSQLDRKACSELTKRSRFDPTATPIADRALRVNWQASTTQ